MAIIFTATASVGLSQKWLGPSTATFTRRPPFMIHTPMSRELGLFVRLIRLINTPGRTYRLAHYCLRAAKFHRVQVQVVSASEFSNLIGSREDGGT